MKLNRLSIALLAVFSFASILMTKVACAKNPNIVFILADDMGSGDVQALNPKSKIPTPNLNRLAKEGMTFTDAHSGSAVCTPTRYGFVTGRYAWRTRLKNGVLNGYGRPLIKRERPTIASFLKSHGYQTGIVGKWHLGLGFARNSDKDQDIDYAKPLDHGPHVLGFEYSYVIPASLDFPPYVYIEDGRVTELPFVTHPSVKFPGFLRKGPRPLGFKFEECLDHLTNKACDFVSQRSKDEQPFFLYFPLTAPHKPVSPHPRFVGKTELGLYGDFVHQVDAVVGRVLQAIDDAGVSDNTLVIYSSDNGSFMFRETNQENKDHVEDETIQRFHIDRHTANHVYRGTKADIYEAGHRVPFFARWPQRIKAASTSETTVCLTDIFATVADAIGQAVPEGAAPDSFSMLRDFEGGKRETTREPVINHSASGMFAIRDGKWKLVLGNGSGGREKPRGKPFQRPYQLYDLANDPSEKNNIISAHTALARQLEQKCLEIRDRDFE